MNISHNGDRVVNYDSNNNYSKCHNDLSNTYIEDLIRENFNFEEISGGYGCSIPEIDFIIDLAKNYDRVYGAQLSGAGLGGCCMILVDKSKSTELKDEILDKYKDKFGKSCSIHICKPVKGLSIFDTI
jgi:mevalonate kinase